ncbi:MAG: hypothetical protein RL370_1148 [Actinomycetota bacterium]|jgi:hypothetical protein
MQFLISVIDNESGTASPSEMVVIDAFNEKLQAHGYWVIAVGIASTSEATTIDNRSGAEVLETGSKLYGAEYMSGFWIIDVPSNDLALELANEGSKACNRKVELRPLLG